MAAGRQSLILTSGMAGGRRLARLLACDDRETSGVRPRLDKRCRGKRDRRDSRCAAHGSAARLPRRLRLNSAKRCFPGLAGAGDGGARRTAGANTSVRSKKKGRVRYLPSRLASGQKKGQEVGQDQCPEGGTLADLVQTARHAMVAVAFD